MINNCEMIGFDHTCFGREQTGNEFGKATMLEEVGDGIEYVVMQGSNEEAIFLVFQDDETIIMADPMFSKGTWFELRLTNAFDVEEPACYYQSKLSFEVLDQGEPCTQLMALMVNKPTWVKGYERNWIGRKRTVVYGIDEIYGTVIHAKLAIFAQKITHFATKQELMETLEPEKISLEGNNTVEVEIGSTSFFPYGLVPPELGDANPNAAGTGLVKGCGTSQSSFNGPEYHWAVIGALGGDFGVVWSPQTASRAKLGAYLSYDGMVIGEVATNYEDA